MPSKRDTDYKWEILCQVMMSMCEDEEWRGIQETEEDQGTLRHEETLSRSCQKGAWCVRAAARTRVAEPEWVRGGSGRGWSRETTRAGHEEPSRTFIDKNLTWESWETTEGLVMGAINRVFVAAVWSAASRGEKQRQGPLGRRLQWSREPGWWRLYLCCSLGWFQFSWITWMTCYVNISMEALHHTSWFIQSFVILDWFNLQSLLFLRCGDNERGEGGMKFPHSNSPSCFPNNLSHSWLWFRLYKSHLPHMIKKTPLLSSLRKSNVLGALCQEWDADQVNTFISHSINISSIFYYSSLHEVTKVKTLVCFLPCLSPFTHDFSHFLY